MKKIITLLIIFVFVLTGCQSNGLDKEKPNTKETNEIEDANKGNEETKEEIDATKDKETEDAEDPETEDVLATDTEDNNKDKEEITVGEAFDLFMSKYPNAKINKIKYELEDRGYEYEVEGYEGNTEYELKIDAKTKEIIKEKQETDDGEYGDIKKDQLGKIDQYIGEASQDAGSEYWIKEWELKEKRDYTEFEIKLKNNQGNKVVFKYNYDTGKLLEKK